MELLTCCRFFSCFMLNFFGFLWFFRWFSRKWWCFCCIFLCFFKDWFTRESRFTREYQFSREKKKKAPEIYHSYLTKNNLKSLGLIVYSKKVKIHPLTLFAFLESRSLYVNLTIYPLNLSDLSDFYEQRSEKLCVHLTFFFMYFCFFLNFF